ncbi:MAG: hypothetical protein QNJ15_14585 [Erythrobacter sp.]|nr:hypothetical protein [Erythrobacter sp.]
MRRRNRPPIGAHPYFVPALALWGAALGGLTIMVLPASFIDQATAVAALGALGEFARLFFAGLAAALGAATGYFVASKWQQRRASRSHAMMNHAADHFRPIDPAAELGSESLDTPIAEDSDDAEERNDAEESDDTKDGDGTSAEEASEEIEASSEDTLELGAEMEAAAQVAPEPASTPADPLADETADTPREPAGRMPLRRRRNRGKQVELVQALSEHRARQTALKKDQLDLGEFTQLAEKNRTSRAKPAPTAIDKLRAVPPQDLSLVQMVERLAVALQERQEAARNRPPAEQTSERDAALAEALKALAVFTENGLAANDEVADLDREASAGTDTRTERDLRDALSKLQTMRGAA